ncbi:MAG: hypothetical protein AB1766_07735 [Pseudomonadota bacterium]
MAVSFTVFVVRFFSFGLFFLACFGTSAMAGEDRFRFSGFGTLGASYHDTPGVVFRRDISQRNGAQSGVLSLRPDSMLGLQFDAHLTDRLDAMVQLISRESIDDAYVPQVSWAYLKYKLGSESSVRIGRMGLEFYLQGDSVEIGYANLMVRPQVIFYPRGFDGVDVENTFPLAGGALRIKAMTGWTHGKLVSGQGVFDTAGSPFLGALAEYQREGWTARLAGGGLKLCKDTSDPELDALRQGLAMAPMGTQILDVISMSNRRQSFVSASLAYDEGPLQAQASYNIIASPDWPDRRIFYANAGYRLERFTPYIGFSAMHMDRDTIATGIPDGLSPQTDRLNAAASIAQSMLKVNQDTWTAGLRYDLGNNLAIKAQVDLMRYIDPSSVIDSAQEMTPAGLREWKRATVYSLSVDFLF